MISIYDWFGYEVAIEDRYKLIKAAGFNGVLLWWSDGFGRGADYKTGVGYARAAGLHIENIHTPVQGQDNLSFDNLDGEAVLECYVQCIKDCSEYGIRLWSYIYRTTGIQSMTWVWSELKELSVWRKNMRLRLPWRI